VGPCQADAQSASLHRASPSVPLAPWRGGLRTPAMTPLGSPEHVPPGPPGVRSPLRDHAVPRPAPCPVSRTRRPHPSEKISFRVNSRLSPLGHLPLDRTPWRGGLRTPARKGPARARHVVIASRPPRHPSWVMKGLGMSTALQRGRAERIPPRKPPLALSPGFPRKAIRAGLVPPGGAGSARPQ
jgi:hypothetical protein